MSSEPAHLLIRAWEDGCVVFDRRSGDTHALDPLAAELLQLPAALRTDPASAAAILSERLLLDPPDAMALHVTQAFEQLQRLALI